MAHHLLLFEQVKVSLLSIEKTDEKLSLWPLQDNTPRWRKGAQGAKHKPCVPDVPLESTQIQIPLKHECSMPACQYIGKPEVSGQTLKFPLVSLSISSPIRRNE